MMAEKTFSNIIQQVQSSNLNFQLQLSPFSVMISLKKTLVKDKFGNIVKPVDTKIPVGAANHHKIMKTEGVNADEATKAENKLGLSWAKLSCQLGFNCALIQNCCIKLINMK